MRRCHLLLQSLLHRLVGPYIALLTREQPADRCLIILVGVDAEVPTVVAIGNERIVKLLHRKGHGQILGVAVPDVVNQSLKESV